MSRILTAKEVCEQALGAIGAFPVTESAADGEQLRRAMHWLDLLMAHTVGTERIFSRVPSTVPLAIVNGTGSYNLNNALGSDLPADGIQFPIEAWLQDSGGNRHPLTIVQRDTFENVSKPESDGRPKWVYIDRIPAAPTLSIYPVPESADPQSYTLYLLVQQYAPNVAPSGITGSQPSGSVLHDFSVAWQWWLIWALSSALASGPIYKLPKSSIDTFDQKADKAFTRLMAFENRQHDSEEPVCEPHGM